MSFFVIQSMPRRIGLLNRDFQKYDLIVTFMELTSYVNLPAQNNKVKWPPVVVVSSPPLPLLDGWQQNIVCVYTAHCSVTKGQGCCKDCGGDEDFGPADRQRASMVASAFSSGQVSEFAGQPCLFV